MDVKQVSTAGNYDFKTNNSIIAKDTELPSEFKKLLYIVIVVTKEEDFSSVCTGCLINDKLVLTLASCLVGGKYADPNPDAIHVYERPSMYHLRAFSVFINPNYHSTDNFISKGYNYALIQVSKSKQTVYPRLPLHMDRFESIRHTCVMGGYGDDDSLDLRDFKLIDMNKTNVEVVVSRKCLDGISVCLHFFDLVPCAEDLGTPMICDGVLYAMYSPRYKHINLPRKCYVKYASRFTCVYNIKEWIDQFIHQPTSNFKWLNNPWKVLLLCIIVFFLMGSIYYGLVEFLQRKFDPAEGFDTPMRLSVVESVRSVERLP